MYRALSLSLSLSRGSQGMVSSMMVLPAWPVSHLHVASCVVHTRQPRLIPSYFFPRRLSPVMCPMPLPMPE